MSTVSSKLRAFAHDHKAMIPVVLAIAGLFILSAFTRVPHFAIVGFAGKALTTLAGVGLFYWIVLSVNRSRGVMFAQTWAIISRDPLATAIYCGLSLLSLAHLVAYLMSA